MNVYKIFCHPDFDFFSLLRHQQNHPLKDYKMRFVLIQPNFGFTGARKLKKNFFIKVYKQVKLEEVKRAFKPKSMRN